MQLSEVRTLTTALLGGSTNLSSDRLDDLINQGIRAIVSAVPTALLPSVVKRATIVPVSSGAESSTYGPKVGTMPSDAIDPAPLQVIIDDKAARKLHPDRIGDLHLISGAPRTGFNAYVDAASDQLYIHVGTKIYITPNNGAEYDLVYTAMPAAISGHTDVVALPDDLLPALPAYVAWHARLADGELEEAQLHQADYTGIVGNYVNADMPRSAGAPQ